MSHKKDEPPLQGEILSAPDTPETRAALAEVLRYVYEVNARLRREKRAADRERKEPRDDQNAA